jgi:tRNA A37 threonylcarbamoyladenosine synthetase subunit TsaC/SUA5/YrdC
MRRPGPAPGGLPSTIVDARSDMARLVREGSVAWAAVLESLK